ncbi:M1-specific T cell receptor beta chain-like [Cheilinus undulatus]|uniref:M1-specific T cell receptor beta chain-like n=1 Tax=Cheilinus undulatus TaxID=241271 RepID=UPI001BD450D1|nr:M1-specific T cell receptor beta chain-like [Cheilinus undulatus]
MLLLPAAALCCLCSALVSMATKLIQDDLTLTRRVSEKVSFRCGRTDRCYNYYVYWYQKKESDTFRRILGIDRHSGALRKRYNHSQEDDFSAVNKGNDCELQIQRVKLSHSASYFCSCEDSGWYDYYMFGSGTKLIVTDDEVVKPVVSVYSATSRVQQQEEDSLLCVASAMSPPLVQISWRRRRKNGDLEELPSAEGKLLKLKVSGCTASTLKIPQRESGTYEYICSVKHEGGTVQDRKEIEAPVPSTSGPPEREPRHLPALQLTDYDPFQSECRVRLLTLLYSVLIVKSLVYCCGLCLLRILTNNTPCIHCTTAD